MRQIQFLPLYTSLVLFLSGCTLGTRMSKHQCPPQQRIVDVHNYTLGPMIVSWPENSVQIDFDESVQIIQNADKNGMVSPITVHVKWHRGSKDYFYPGIKVDSYFFGPREMLELIENRNLTDVVTCCY